MNLLFPRYCLGCGREGAYFCADCLNRVSLCFETVCPWCNQFSPDGLSHPACREMSPLAGLTSAFNYVGLIEKAIKKLKYHFVSDLAKDLTELFLTFVGEHKAFTQFCQQTPILAPIPLHQKRLNWRGFNQSELLGKKIAQNLNVPFCPDLLRRVKETLPQVELSKEDRLKNISDAFILNPRFVIHNSQFILFDDIWTSGATLREAAKVLKRAGAASVWALTLVR